MHVQGLLANSPLLGEASENETASPFFANNDEINVPFDLSLVDDSTEIPSQRAQYLGNIVNNRNNVISVAGTLSTSQDVDFYQIDLFNDNVDDGIRSTIFDVDYADGFNRPDTNISVFFDPDGEFDRTTEPRLVLFGTDSNILDDLTSPNGENDGSEKLSRGSVATGDPLIGPVTLIEGTYYVAISAEGVEPRALSESQFIRREPVNSVRRIAEQRFDVFETPSTAGGPVLSELFDSGSILASGFEVLGDGLIGHGKPSPYDESNGPVVSSNTIFPEFFIAGGDAPGTSFALPNIDAFAWSLEDENEIGGEFISGISDNTSRYIPHLSIAGNIGTGDANGVDLYEFTVPQDGSRVILDVDEGFDYREVLDPASGSITFVPEPSAVDTTLYLFVETGLGTYAPVTNSTQSDTRDGRSGSNSIEDPFFDTGRFGFSGLNAGTYVVAVAQSQQVVSIDANTGAIVSPTQGNALGPLDYRLHISVEDHELPPRGIINETLTYDRLNNNAPATITSQVFDLAGYVAEDKPMFYFNYRFDPFVDLITDPLNPDTDDAEIRIFSNENPAGRAIANNFNLQADNTWFQVREDLGRFRRTYWNTD